MKLNNKVLIACDWGTQPNTRVYHIANYLKINGKDVTVMGRLNSKIPNRDFVTFLDIPFNNKVYLDNIIFRSLIRLFLFYHFIKYIQNNRPSFVHCRSFYIVLLLILVKNIFRFQIIYETHGHRFKEQFFESKIIKSKITEYLQNFLYKNINKTITISEALSRSIKSRYNKDLVYIVPNGIDLDLIDSISCKVKKNGKKLVGFVGHWEPWMDIEEFLESSNYLNDKRIKYIVVGTGPNIKSYKKTYDKVYFSGALDFKSAISLMKSFDICILPHSDSDIMLEKSARKTFEYLATAKPIIVPDVIGKETFLIKDVNCKLYQKNNPKDLYDKILELLNNRELAGRMSSENRILSKNFTWEEIFAKSNIKECFSN